MVGNSLVREAPSLGRYGDQSGLAAVPFVSMIASRQGLESWSKWYFFPDVGKVTFGIYALLSLTAKVIIFCCK